MGISDFRDTLRPVLERGIAVINDWHEWISAGTLPAEEASFAGALQSCYQTALMCLENDAVAAQKNIYVAIHHADLWHHPDWYAAASGERVDDDDAAREALEADIFALTYGIGLGSEEVARWEYRLVSERAAVIFDHAPAKFDVVEESILLSRMRVLRACYESMLFCFQRQSSSASQQMRVVQAEIEVWRALLQLR
jgi:hypothetical protein